MKDTYFPDDLSPADWEEVEAPAPRAEGHGIRPRRRAPRAEAPTLPRTRLKPLSAPQQEAPLPEAPDLIEAQALPALPSRAAEPA